MPAKIIIAADSAPEAEFWIEEEVLRIGSDGDCELVLIEDSLPPHAGTLEFEDGRYRFFPRELSRFTLAGQVFSGHQPRTWPAGEELRLGNSTVLRLVCEGDPRPARRPSAIMIEADEDESVSDESQSQLAASQASRKKKKYVQLVVILLCLVGVVAMQGAPAPRAEVSDQDRFDSIILACGPEQRSLRAQLQAAWENDQTNRSDGDQVVRAYQELVQRLALRQEECRRAGKSWPDAEQQIRGFAESRLLAQ